MGAKFSDLPQREETAAQEFEIGTLAGYSERLAHIGGEFVARGRGRRLHWARRRAPVCAQVRLACFDLSIDS